MNSATKEEIFHRAILWRGGRADLNELGIAKFFDVHRRGGYTVISEIQEESKKFNIDLPLPHIDFIENSSLNACAFIFEGFDFIGINWGAVLVIREVFDRIMSCPNILPHIGDPSKVTALPKLFNMNITDWEVLQ